MRDTSMRGRGSSSKGEQECGEKERSHACFVVETIASEKKSAGKFKFQARDFFSGDRCNLRLCFFFSRSPFRPPCVCVRVCLCGRPAQY